MNRAKNNYIKESLLSESTIYPVSNIINLNHLKGALSICKIKANFYDDEYGNRDSKVEKTGFGTGSFIKFRDGNKFQYFLMTCEHVIQKEIIEKDNQEIELFYHFESISKKITLNRDERFIKEYMQFGIDVTIVELFQEDVPWQYFLEPEYSCINGFDQYKRKNIIIHQFPLASEQCYSISTIDKCERETMFYKASTQRGSSGSPIILEDSQNILAVHKNGGNDYNKANFILAIIKDKERINHKSYRTETNKNINNFTDKQILIQKTKNKYIFKKVPYIINLYFKEGENKLIFSIQNNDTNNLYEYSEEFGNSFKIFDNTEKIQELFDLFEKTIYKGEIIEKEVQLISIIIGKDDITLKPIYPSNLNNNCDYGHFKRLHQKNRQYYNDNIRGKPKKLYIHQQINTIPCEFYVGQEKKILSDFLQINKRPPNYFPLKKTFGEMNPFNYMIINTINNFENENIENDKKDEEKQKKAEIKNEKEASNDCFIY